jgi:hypothetical protein
VSAVEKSCGLVLLVLEVVGALMLLLIPTALDVVLEASHPPAISILFRIGDKRGFTVKPSRLCTFLGWDMSLCLCVVVMLRKGAVAL